jgi:hypothetical protein
MSMLLDSVDESTVIRACHTGGRAARSHFDRSTGTRGAGRAPQFDHITVQCAKFIATGDPVISVDTKKELIGMAVPYGIYERLDDLSFA